MASNPLRAANSNDWPEPVIVDARGNPYVRGTVTNDRSNSLGTGKGSGEGGAGGHEVSIAELKKNVGFLNWVAGSATVAIVALYFILSAQIGNSFTGANSRIDHLSEQVTDVRVSVAGQNADIKAILEKLNGGKPERSPPQR